MYHPCWVGIWTERPLLYWCGTRRWDSVADLHVGEQISETLSDHRLHLSASRTNSHLNKQVVFILHNHQSLHFITLREDSWFFHDILQSDWQGVIKQGSKPRDLPLFGSLQPIKLQSEWFTIVWKLLSNQIAAWVSYPCMKAISQSNCSLSDLPMVIYPCSIFLGPQIWNKINDKKTWEKFKNYQNIWSLIEWNISAYSSGKSDVVMISFVVILPTLHRAPNWS